MQIRTNRLRQKGRLRLRLRIRIRKKVSILIFSTLILISTLILTFIAYAGIVGTKHDLTPSTPRGWTTFSPAQQIYVSGVGKTTEKCVFCHTPHSVSDSYPLWNHQLSTAWYTNLPSPSQPEWADLLTTVQQPDRGAKLCLGCHDGTVAIGGAGVRNRPGRGTGPTITMTGVTAEGYMPTTAYGWVTVSQKHPFSIAVNSQLITDKYNQTYCYDGEGTFFRLCAPPAGDPVKLRPTDNTYSGSGGSGVQCRTCHDPHDDTRGDFLVKGNPDPGDNTPLCNTCHIPCADSCP